MNESTKFYDFGFGTKQQMRWC